MIPIRGLAFEVLSVATSFTERAPRAVELTSMRNYSLLIIGALTFLFVGATVVTVQEISWHEAVLASVLLVSPFAVVSIAFLATVKHSLRTQLPSVIVEDDDITLHCTAIVMTVKITECRYRYGLACSTQLKQCMKLFCFRPVILVKFPPPLTDRRHAVVAVAYTDLMMSKWRDTLSDHGIDIAKRRGVRSRFFFCFLQVWKGDIEIAVGKKRGH